MAIDMSGILWRDMQEIREHGRTFGVRHARNVRDMCANMVNAVTSRSGCRSDEHEHERIWRHTADIYWMSGNRSQAIPPHSATWLANPMTCEHDNFGENENVRNVGKEWRMSATE